MILRCGGCVRKRCGCRRRGGLEMGSELACVLEPQIWLVSEWGGGYIGKVKENIT